MLKRETLEAAIISAAKLQGHALNLQELLLVRTGVSTALAAKERHRRRMSTASFHWKKPAPRR